MKVFKFGGASVKDADAVKNMAAIIALHKTEPLFVVVSAMGKTTNALEEFNTSLYNNREESSIILDGIKAFHFDIVKHLFDNENHPVYNALHNTFVELDWLLDEDPEQDFNHTYDQVVSIGEMLSTKIVSHFLNQHDIGNKWVDIRDFLRTDNTYREANVDWDETTHLFEAEKSNYFNNNSICVTQGFIGGTSENFTTTLGREGSDYTASIIGFLSNATDVTIWKDVPGVLNADPKKFANTVLIPHLSYLDAVELTYYGATVIHPKTIKPLQNKNIPLLVKSFINYNEPGTRIDANAASNLPSCFIFKPNQILLSLSGKDFSFIAEENISKIFSILASFHSKVNLMQNSAISFSICIDSSEHYNELISELGKDFYVKYNNEVELFTVRHYTTASIDELLNDKTVILEQRSRNTVQVVVRK